MKKIMVFCIPAHGHHNPTLPVVAELVKRGNWVRYFSFEDFREKIQATGAEFIACDCFLPALSQEEAAAIRSVSTTEMTIADLQTTAAMDGFLAEQVKEFQPDVIFSDSVCFWGKLTARKYQIPLVVSTTTFAFNKFSSQYMKNSFSEIWDIIKGSKRVKSQLKALEAYGYHEKSILSLVQNDNFTDTIVYATEHYQPCSNTFSKHYAFVGPSLFTKLTPNKKKERPLIYIAMGTVINDRPDFYQDCIQALSNENVDIVIACGKSVDITKLGTLPANVSVHPHVDQPEVLSRADVFLTHCGMNSVTESLFMATPMVLFPQTNEQRAVATRAKEMGAGILLKKADVGSIRSAVLTILNNPTYSEKAAACSRDFRSALGPAGAAAFLEAAPHKIPEEDRRLKRKEILPGILQLLFWVVAISLILLLPRLIPAIPWWATAIFANVLFAPYKKWTETI